MKVSILQEKQIADLGHAFGYYDYGAEHGLIDAFPSRDAVAAFIRGYVRMAFRNGMLYATSENGEGYIVYKLPGQKVALRSMLPLAKAFFFRDVAAGNRVLSVGDGKRRRGTGQAA